MIPHVDDTKDSETIDLPYAFEKPKKNVWRDWILLNKPLKLTIVFIITALVAPVLIYQYLFFPSLELPPSDGLSTGSCLISREARIPCGYGNVTADQCHNDCCYDQTNSLCFHRFPSRFSYVLNEKWSEEAVMSPRIFTVPFGSQDSFTNVKLSIDEVSTTHLTLTFYNAEDVNITARRIEEKNYEYNVTGPELHVTVNSSNRNIFNTNRGPFIASDNIWEMSFKITDEKMYGLGEIPLKEDTVKVIYSRKDGLSSVPLIFAKSNGSYHGLLFDAMNPTEIHVRAENQLVVRSITNWGLKFHLFVGPKPSDIMKDVIDIIGANKKLEYWMLGAHICSDFCESTPTTVVADLREFINTANSQSVPFESHCGVAPVLFNTECNNDYVRLVNDGAAAIRTLRKKFVPHVTPYIQYTAPEIPEIEEDDDVTETSPIIRTSQLNRCFDDEQYKQFIIKDPDSEQVYIGTVDDHEVVYPEYDNVDEEFMQHLWKFGDVDAVVLKNNWPLDQSETVNETRLYLPYFSEHFEAAFAQTPLWNATRTKVIPIIEEIEIETTTAEYNSTEFDMFLVTELDETDLNDTEIEPPRNYTRNEKYLHSHNSYGSEFATAFEMVKDVFTTSTSQWMNGKVAVNRQGIETSWSSLQRELILMSLGSISGHRYWATPICGDTENFNATTQNRLCAKWYMAATYFPLVNVHSKEVRRDPLAFVGNDRADMIKALQRRMSIMPYLYAVLMEGPLLRPMFYQYPYIDELSDLTSQFSVGDDLLIVPNLQPSQSHVHFRMPPGQWFEFWSGLRVQGEVGEAVTMVTTEADFLTLARGGSIFVQQLELRQSLADIQLTEYTILLVLNCETTYVVETTTEEATTETTTTENDDDAFIRVDTETKTTTPEPTTTETPTITTCSAKGKFYTSPSMVFFLEADDHTITVTVQGDDFDSLCDWNNAMWAKDVWYLNVYGLDKEMNNFDHHMHKWIDIDFCELEYSDKIVVEY